MFEKIKYERILSDPLMAPHSHDMISDVFKELLKEKEYKDISISEICERAGISKRMFYRLFRSKRTLREYTWKYNSDIFVFADPFIPNFRELKRLHGRY